MKKMEIKVEDGNSVIIMKKSSLFLSVALLIGATSCTEEVFVQNIKDGSEAVELEFEAASSEWDTSSKTRTLVREGEQTMWIANDRIGIFAGGTNDVSYPFITKDGGIVANFKGTVEETASIYCALYPYNKESTLENYVFTTVLYAQQYAEPNSYASGMNLAVSRSYENSAQDLNFSNAASYLCVSIPSDYSGDDIYSMRLKGNNGELLAGNVRIDVYEVRETPAIVIDDEDASETIYLNQINPGAKCLKGKDYYFVLAPTDMTQGYTLTLVNGEGKIAIIEGEPTNFERNHVYHIVIDETAFGGDECGTITDDGLFTVTDLDCLYTWASRVAAGESSLGCYLTADIDFEGDTRDWPEIGTDEIPFTGKVMGNGKTISNFKNETDNRYAGFIHVMGEEGTVENLTFDSPTITSKYIGDVTSTFDDGYVGVIVGKLNAQDQFNYTSGSITNCHVINPTIEGGENVGGIVGRSFGRNDAITNCTVSGGTIQGSMFVGGIAGNSEGIIENCHVKNGTQISYIDSQAEARVGGIVGTNNSGQVVACTANTIVNGKADVLDARYCGGIAGANNGTIIGCASSGKVVSDYGGAIAGESYGDIYGCYANQTEAAALIYKIKKNMNDPADVTLPTFKACYWNTSSGNSVIGSGEESGMVSQCNIVDNLKSMLPTMNSALDEVRGNTDYAYGAYYEYEQNTGDDNGFIPYKATKPQ